MSINQPFDESKLASYPVEDGFRMRGVEMTRVEVFVDAAFAFALTLLVVSGDTVPSDFGELLLALKGVPTFGVTFMLLMLFWSAHRKWSRRFGLEDAAVIWLSGFFVFVMLTWVYPLRMVFGGFFAFLSDGWLPSHAEFSSYFEFRMLFIVYGVGFFLLSTVILALNRRALSMRELLQLDDLEAFDTRAEIIGWIPPALVSVLSVLLAVFLPDPLIAISGFCYFILAITGPLLGMRSLRRRRALLENQKSPA